MLPGESWVEVPPRDTDAGPVRTWLLHATAREVPGTHAVLELLPNGDWWFLDVADLRSGRGRSAEAAIADAGYSLVCPI